MKNYVIISLLSGGLFGFMDGVIIGNPLARNLFSFLKPIAKTKINIPVGLFIDLFYGFVLAGIFILLYSSLPGQNGILKGLSYGILIWFFRIVMNSASQWMTINIPISTLVYILIAGLIEMLILGILYGLTLKPQV